MHSTSRINRSSRPHSEHTRYDAAGRKSTESLTISGQTYTSTSEYDAAGRVSKLIYPDASEVSRTYTARGQLHTLVSGLTTIDTRAYDDGGRMTSSSYNNGVSESRTYNTDDTLASISFTGAPIGDYSYGWDANKNKTSESITGTMSGYGFSAGYDAEDRLVNWQRSDTNLDQSWDLSPVGDWNSITENTSTQNRTHGAAHELLSAANQSLQHDAKGNMTLIPAVLRSGSNPLAMQWDFENKLASADANGDGVDDVFYKWDALGRRVGRDDGTTHTVYFQDGQQTIADYGAGVAAGSPSYKYIYASYVDEPVLRVDSSGMTLYYHRNQQYSVVALTNASGGIVERYAYTAYGEPTVLDGAGTVLAGSTHRYTYTGREWDSELELYHYRARMYSATEGRFVSRDPIGYAGSEWNWYEYAASSPGTFVDPQGRSPQPANQRPPTVNGKCELKYLHIDPDMDSDAIAGKIAELLRCVANDVPIKGPKRAMRDCMKKVGIGVGEDLGAKAIEALANTICCFEAQKKGRTGDPCKYGTPDDALPGTKPPGKCFDPKDDTTPVPKLCGECCDFRLCSARVSDILGGESIFDFLFKTRDAHRKEHQECLERCKGNDEQGSL